MKKEITIFLTQRNETKIHFLSFVEQEFLNGGEPQRNLQPLAEGFQSEAYLEVEVHDFKHYKTVI